MMPPFMDLTFLTTLHAIAANSPKAGAKELTYWARRLDMPHARIMGNVRSWPFASPLPADMISGPLALNWSIGNLPVI